MPATLYVNDKPQKVSREMPSSTTDITDNIAKARKPRCGFKHLASVGQLRCIQIENIQGICHSSAFYMLNVYQNHVLKYRFPSEALSLRRDSLTERLGDRTHNPRMPTPHHGPGGRRKVPDPKRRALPWFSLHLHMLVGSGHFINTLSSCFLKNTILMLFMYASV